jgi:hypothetical protein
MVPQPQIHFAKPNLKNLRAPVSMLNIPKWDATSWGTATPGCPMTNKILRRTGAKKVVRSIFHRLPQSNDHGAMTTVTWED